MFRGFADHGFWCVGLGDVHEHAGMAWGGGREDKFELGVCGDVGVRGQVRFAMDLRVSDDPQRRGER